MSQISDSSSRAIEIAPLMTQASPSPMVVGAPMGMSAADRFFNGDDGLVSVWDFDYDTIIDFNTQLQWAALLSTPPAWISCLCCYPCFLRKNVVWSSRAKHIALTVDGIRYVTEKHPTMCGLSFTDRGKESKTVPYDKITDCDVQEPAGTAFCCFIPNVLTHIHVDTASSGRGGGHELVIQGLKDANEFKQAVWEMKRSDLPKTSAQGAGQRVPVQAQMQQTELLTDIRDLLLKLNENIQNQNKGSSAPSAPSAPPADGLHLRRQQ